MNCRVCNSHIEGPVFASGRKTSLTSMCTPQAQETVVFLCRECGHLQTPPLENLDEYYDSEYRMSIDAPEEDQLYKMVDGNPVYRTAFQAATIADKLDIASGARVLDFGAAKGMTARHLAALRPDVELYTFDISDRYRRYWAEFLPDERTATYEVPDEWKGKFDVVMSFYVLEHVDEPAMYVEQVRELLAPGGTFYMIVPNTFTNLSDFVVVDHVNHFTEPSLRNLLARHRLDVQWVDPETHTGAWIVAATTTDDDGERQQVPATSVIPQAEQLADRWSAIYRSLDVMSATAAMHTSAVYGASFFGTLIYTSLDSTDNVMQFLDQNPHLQGREQFGKPITAPSGLEPGVTDVLVGLDPLRARGIIASVEVLQNRGLRFHYLGEEP